MEALKINWFGSKKVIKKAPVVGIPNSIQMCEVTYKCKNHKVPFEFSAENVVGTYNPAKSVMCPNCKKMGMCELIKVGKVTRTIPVRGL